MAPPQLHKVWKAVRPWKPPREFPEGICMSVLLLVPASLLITAPPLYVHGMCL